MMLRKRDEAQTLPEPVTVEEARDYDYNNENDASYCNVHVQVCNFHLIIKSYLFIFNFLYLPFSFVSEMTWTLIVYKQFFQDGDEWTNEDATAAGDLHDQVKTAQLEEIGEMLEPPTKVNIIICYPTTKDYELFTSY